MKKLFFGLIAAIMLTACHHTDKNALSDTGANPPVIKFTEEAFNFGKIKEGASVTHEFAFTNTGKSPLIITNAVATCGCTTPVWPKEPVNPGEKGSVKVTFNSTGKSGIQDKMITVSANTTPAQSMVHLTGEVEASKSDASPAQGNAKK